jgi:hypothetical protein
MFQQVVLAPVPWVHLQAAEGVPALRERVAFGSSTNAIPAFPIGLPVFIYGSDPSHNRFKPGVVTWEGTMGAVVPAVERGRRSGQHPDPSVRPPSADEDDTAFLWFFEVLGLKPLAVPRKLSEFTKIDGRGKPYTGDVPQWPVLAYLDC